MMWHFLAAPLLLVLSCPDTVASAVDQAAMTTLPSFLRLEASLAHRSLTSSMLAQMAHGFGAWREAGRIRDRG